MYAQCTIFKLVLIIAKRCLHPPSTPACIHLFAGDCMRCRFYGTNKICCAYILFNKWIYFGCAFVVFSVSFTTNQFNFNLKFDFIPINKWQIDERAQRTSEGESERNLIRICECMREKWTIQLRIYHGQCMQSRHSCACMFHGIMSIALISSYRTIEIIVKTHRVQHKWMQFKFNLNFVTFFAHSLSYTVAR